MKYKVVSYCPDRHIEYDGETPYKIGIGGGVTARVRMAKALAMIGHDVTMVVNCPQERWVDGVHYIPLSEVGSIESDVLILNSSGDQLDLSPALDLDISTRVRIVWAHGIQKPGGLDQLKPDYVYAVSNYIARIVERDWWIPLNRILVTFNGFDDELYKNMHEQVRDNYKLIYCSHPSKGLDAAIAILRMLRKEDKKFHLDYIGGAELWGEDEYIEIKEPGVMNFGLMGQSALMLMLSKAGIALNLQNRSEPFGLAALEAIRAGCLTLASPVGAYPEFIHHGINGFLIEGDSTLRATHEAATDLILRLFTKPDLTVKIRREAQSNPWSSMKLASIWSSHWHSVLS